LLRGKADDVLNYLKTGEAELALGCNIDDAWDRLDVWPLFTENFQLLVGASHALASRPAVEIDDIRQERLAVRNYCESTVQLIDLLRMRAFDVDHVHEMSAEADLIALLEAGFGVSFFPRSTMSPPTLTRIAVDGFDLSRRVCLYGVAGRQRTAVASALMKMLRAADWSRFEATAPI
jgi:DNA-binding transcriptional LysR family regulator